VRLLLDTAVLIYAVESPGRLSKRVAAALVDSENVLELSAVSVAEIAIKSALNKLRFSAADARQSVTDLDIRILPFWGVHAFQLFDLPLHHRDPFDRQIIAQALCEKIPVVTPDAAFGLYKGLKLIW
jgi:PIN domain nuclease of toxin-antitoxin system